MSIQTTIDRAWTHIHPVALPLFTRLDALLQVGHTEGVTHTLFGRFETFRHPARQDYLFDKKKTKARAWQSAHQFGLGIDFVPIVNGIWSWSEEHDWKFLRSSAESIGLCNSLTWDRPHVWHPVWDEVRQRL